MYKYLISLCWYKDVNLVLMYKHWILCTMLQRSMNISSRQFTMTPGQPVLFYPASGRETT